MKYPLKMMFLYFYSFEYKQKNDNDSLPCRLLRIHLSDELILKGINFTELVNSLGKPEILNLERGKRFI